MRRFFNVLLVFGLISGISFTFMVAEEKAPESSLFNVSDSVVMLKHIHGSNISCIALDDGLYFVDCGLNTENAARFRKQMEKRFNKKTVALLLTHAHLDHFLGMAAFSDVKVLAVASGKPMFEKQLAIEFNERQIVAYTGVFPKFREAVKTAKPFLPAEWFEDEVRLGKEGNVIVFTKTGGHSLDSASVYYEKEGVLVSGDLVQVDQYPYFGDPSNDFTKWIGALKRWYGMPVKKVCPGHGRVVDKEFLKLMSDYFEALIAKVKELKKKSVPVQEVLRHKELPAGYWAKELPRPRWFDYCIGMLYQRS